MKRSIFVLLIIAINIIGCKKEEMKDISVIHFNRGEERAVQFNSQEELESFSGLLKELIAGTDDKLRLLVNEDRIQQIKNNTDGIEIKFSGSRILHSSILEDYQVDGLLIPFSGEFAGQDGVATIFLADKVYLSGPLRNSRGREIIKLIEELIAP